jgi:hypothetical protein
LNETTPAEPARAATNQSVESRLSVANHQSAWAREIQQRFERALRPALLVDGDRHHRENRGEQD